MFLHLSVILFTGGCLPRHLQPPSRHSPDRHSPTLQDGHCSGRYASYWNAFLYSQWLPPAKRGCGKVMLSLVTVRQSHLSWDRSYGREPLSPSRHQTWAPIPRPGHQIWAHSPSSPGHETWAPAPSPPLDIRPGHVPLLLPPPDIRPRHLLRSPNTDIWVITADLFKLGHLRTYPSPQHWHLVMATETCTIGKPAVCILLECFLVSLCGHYYISFKLDFFCHDNFISTNKGFKLDISFSVRLFFIYESVRPSFRTHSSPDILSCYFQNLSGWTQSYRTE